MVTPKRSHTRACNTGRKEVSLNQKNKGAAKDKPRFVVQGCLEMDSACSTHLPLSLILATAYLTGHWPCTFDVNSVIVYVSVVIYFTADLIFERFDINFMNFTG